MKPSPPDTEPPRFTAHAVSSFEHAGQTVFRSASASSAVSQTDAEARAKAAARLRAEAAGRGQVLRHDHDRYPYPERVLVEPVLERVTAGGHEIARLTRNGYGATVLNAYAVMFVDVDTEKDSSNAATEALVDSKQAIAALAALCDRRADVRFRVYQTRAGLRYLCTSRLFDPASGEAAEVLALLHSDQRYRLLCRVQKCFRARLTPKPWRCLQAAPPPSGLFGRLKAAASAAKAADPAHFAACRYLETIGRAEPIEPAAQTIWEIHDRLAGAASPKPLA